MNFQNNIHRKICLYKMNNSRSEISSVMAFAGSQLLRCVVVHKGGDGIHG